MWQQQPCSCPDCSYRLKPCLSINPQTTIVGFSIVLFISYLFTKKAIRIKRVDHLVGYVFMERQGLKNGLIVACIYSDTKTFYLGKLLFDSILMLLGFRNLYDLSSCFSFLLTFSRVSVMRKDQSLARSICYLLQVMGMGESRPFTTNYA